MELVSISEEVIVENDKLIIKKYKFSLNGKIFEIHEEISDTFGIRQEIHGIVFKNMNTAIGMTNIYINESVYFGCMKEGNL